MSNPSVVIVSPALADANNGNWRTARRWKKLLSPAFNARVVQQWPDAHAPTDALMLALHARRSADSIQNWARTRPGRGLAVVLTGTDLYQDIASDPSAQRSLQLAQRLVVLQELGTQALHEYLSAPALSTHPLGAAVQRGSREDRQILYHLLDRLSERAAKLAALTLSAAVLKSGAGEDPCAPACAVVEGSVYWGLKGMRRKLDCYLKGFLEESHGRHLELVQVENASLLGAAIAGLTN
jgi:hypothetical protein